MTKVNCGVALAIVGTTLAVLAYIDTDTANKAVVPFLIVVAVLVVLYFTAPNGRQRV